MIELYVIELENGCYAEFYQEDEKDIMVFNHEKPYHASLFDSLSEAEETMKEAKDSDSDWTYYGDLNFNRIRKINFTME